MLFKTAARDSISRRILRAGTLQEYQRLAALAELRLGRLHVKAIQRKHVQECLAGARQDGLSAKSVRNLLAFVSTVLKDAGSSAAAGVHVPVPEPDLRPLTAEQAQQLDEHLAGLEVPEALALRALLATGLRRGELLALESADWMEGQQQVQVARSTSGPTKSGRIRYVDVPSRMVTEFSELAARGGRLFPVQARQLGRVLDRATKELGLPRARVHDLRHTRVTLQLLAGVSVLYVCQQAGHHSPAFTMSRYGHLALATPTQRREWADAS